MHIKDILIRVKSSSLAYYTWLGTTSTKVEEMKIYGYKSKDSELIPLEELTLQATVNELKELIDFIKHTVSLMETYKDNFTHEHLNDFKMKSSPDEPDIIITNK
ncbi:Uncharacterised protein [Hafnia alvei]|nr:Uncharacterised protein [Hafnia alvei]